MRKRAKIRKNIIQEVVNLSEESKMKINPAKSCSRNLQLVSGTVHVETLGWVTMFMCGL